jgi:hypothetical protein
MNKQSIADLFREYDQITKHIGQVEHLINTNQTYPSVGMNVIVELELDKWQIRRQINSVFTEQAQEKSLWKRIFKK